RAVTCSYANGSYLEQPHPRAPGIDRLDAVRQLRHPGAALAEALFLRGEQLLLLRHQREPGEPGRGVVALAGALALPDGHAEMMVIAARRQERGAVAVAGRVEANRAVIEAFGLREIANTQVHVANAQAVRRLGVVADARVGQRQQIWNVELVGGHLHAAL